MKHFRLILCLCVLMLAATVAVADAAATQPYFTGAWKVFSAGGQFVGENSIVVYANNKVTITHPNGQSTTGIFISGGAGYFIRVPAWDNADGSCGRAGSLCETIYWSGGNQAATGSKWERIIR